MSVPREQNHLGVRIGEGYQAWFYGEGQGEDWWNQVQYHVQLPSGARSLQSRGKEKD